MVLFTRAQFALLLKNGEAYGADPDFNPQPVVKLFKPVGSASKFLMPKVLSETNDMNQIRAPKGGAPEPV